jgi:hypothetical protein
MQNWHGRPDAEAFYECRKRGFEYNGLDTMRSALLSSARAFSGEFHSSDQDAEVNSGK